MYKDLLNFILKDETGIKNIKHAPDPRNREAFPQFEYSDEPQMVISPHGKIVTDGGKVTAVSNANPSPIEAIRFYEHILSALPQGFSGDLDSGVDIRYIANEAGDKVHVVITGHMD